MNSLTAKIFKLTLIVIVTTLVVTNPGSAKYEAYALKQLINYFKSDLCARLTQKAGDNLRSPCYALIDTASPQIKVALNKNTKRQNFFLFSIYQTDFSLPPIVPEYRFATLGIFDRFFTYESESNQ